MKESTLRMLTGSGALLTGLAAVVGILASLDLIPRLGDRASLERESLASVSAEAPRSSPETNTEEDRAKRRLSADGIAPTAKELARAVEEDRIARVDLLLRAGVSPDAKTTAKYTVSRFGPENETVFTFSVPVLTRVCTEGRIEIVRLLLEHGANPAETERLLGTDGPLMWSLGSPPLAFLAVFGAKGRDEVVAGMLLDAGADVNASDRNGSTIVFIAVGSDKPALVEFLLKRGADANARTDRGQTPMMTAAQMGDLELLELITGFDSNLNATQNDGWTALTFAAEEGHLDVVRKLLALGIYVDGKTLHGETALHRAAWRGHGEVVEVLLESGASKNATTTQGNTPVDVAQNDTIRALFSSSHARR